ncbi:MAG: hypothetical protein K6B70_02245 [Clostridia bacterium]|nr:hypothetical protein [Clostridia bacterium]
MHNFGKAENNFDYSLKKQNTEDEKCVLLFSQCDNKYPLWKLNANELKEFISFAKRIESLTWREIKTLDGLNYESLPNLEKPQNLDKDITLYSMRISKKFRLIGHRRDRFFYIVWFDRNHKTC